VLVLVLVACGGEKSPVEKCDDLVNVVCDRGVECIGGSTHQECVQAVQQQLPCGSAKSVSASYNRCIDQLNNDSCQILFPTDPQTGQQSLVLPADCMSVILAREVPAPVTNPEWEQVSWAADAE